MKTQKCCIVYVNYIYMGLYELLFGGSSENTKINTLNEHFDILEKKCIRLSDFFIVHRFSAT